MADEVMEAGWGNPLVSKKWHYFRRGAAMSLCMRVAYFGEREVGNDSSPDNCAECKRRKAKMEGK